MKASVTLQHDRFIIVCLLSFLIAFFSPLVSYAQERENRAEVSSFYELTESLNQMQSTGGHCCFDAGYHRSRRRILYL